MKRLLCFWPLIRRWMSYTSCGTDLCMSSRKAPMLADCTPRHEFGFILLASCLHPLELQLERSNRCVIIELYVHLRLRLGFTENQRVMHRRLLFVNGDCPGRLVSGLQTRLAVADLRASFRSWFHASHKVRLPCVQAIIQKDYSRSSTPGKSSPVPFFFCEFIFTCLEAKLLQSRLSTLVGWSPSICIGQSLVVPSHALSFLFLLVVVGVSIRPARS